jgi:acyl carrier protein phosphodiesterase
MNHLAHLYLAPTAAQLLIGNLAGDFVKGPLHAGRFAPEIATGIAQHRKIDVFTDAHPRVAEFRRVLLPEHGHWARVISDVFFDHFLAASFEELTGEPLETFLARVYATIDPFADALPGTLGVVYPHMREGRWLLSYREIGGIHTALENMSRRIVRRPPLQMATRHLTDSREELESHFRAFWPDVVTYARSLHS